MSFMSNAPDTPEPSPAPGAFATLRKPLFIIGVLFVVWLLVGHMAQYFLPARPVEPAPRMPLSAPTPPPIVSPKKDERINELQNHIALLETKLKNMEDLLVALPKSSGENAASDD